MKHAIILLVFCISASSTEDLHNQRDLHAATYYLDSFIDWMINMCMDTQGCFSVYSTLRFINDMTGSWSSICNTHISRFGFNDLGVNLPFFHGCGSSIFSNTLRQTGEITINLNVPITFNIILQIQALRISALDCYKANYLRIEDGVPENATHYCGNLPPWTRTLQTHQARVILAINQTPDNVYLHIKYSAVDKRRHGFRDTGILDAPGILSANCASMENISSYQSWLITYPLMHYVVLTAQSDCSAQIHDGPGLLSSIIWNSNATPHMSRRRASSHQSFVILWPCTTPTDSNCTRVLQIDFTSRKKGCVG